MSRIDEMTSYMEKLATGVKDPAKRARCVRRHEVMRSVSRLRDLAIRVRGRDTIVTTFDMIDALEDLLTLDLAPVLANAPGDSRIESVTLNGETLFGPEGPATRPMRAVGVVTRTGVLTDSTEREG